jgi:hypothetical protein
MVRMGLVIGILAVEQLGFWAVGHLSNPSVIEPRQPLSNFPMKVTTAETGTWDGKPTKLDDQMFDESEVSAVETRLYVKEGRTLKFLLAEYREPSKGLYHNPMNCYHSQGYTLVGDVEKRPLVVGPSRPDTEISIANWLKKGENGKENVIVAYWYEIGDHTMFERSDLWDTQKAMFGKTEWPVMFKVLLEMPAGEGAAVEQTKGELLGMAQEVRKWLATAWEPPTR